MPIQLPIGSEAEFAGIIDLVTEKATIYKDDLGKDIEVVDIPEDLVDAAHEARTVLIEAIAEFDDELMESYLADEPLDEARVKAAIRAATLAMTMTPVLCGSSFKNKGVQPLLDAVIDYLPSPLEVPPIIGHHPKTDDEETARRPPTKLRSRARLQDRNRPVRRKARLLPCLLRNADRRHPRSSTRRPARPSVSAAS